MPCTVDDLNATMQFKPYKKRVSDGLFTDMPPREYRKTPHLSSTMLRILMRSPLEYRRICDGLVRSEPTEAMEFGTAAHAAILENRFDAFHIKPDTYGADKPWNGNATECKTWTEAHNDKPIITSKQVQELSSAASYIKAHPKCSKILRDGSAEVSGFFGNVKARYDYIAVKGDSAIVVDLKTCMDASTGAFGREILNRGYHIQFAWYRRVLTGLGIRNTQFFFIALQKGQLPLVNVWQLHPMAMDMADKKIDEALGLLAKCEANKEWPEWADYDGTNEIKVVDVPEWAYPEEELTGAEEIES